MSEDGFHFLRLLLFMASYSLDVHLCDGQTSEMEISYITLMFFDTVMAELSREYGCCDHFQYEDEDGDRIAVRSDEDLPAFASHLQRDGFATIWLVECTTSDLNDIPAIFPSDLKHLNLISHGQFGSVYRSVHLPTDRVLAVKCISLGEFDEQKDVLKELALMKKCSPCEYVVSLVGGSVDSQVLYICLEYMDGGSIGGYDLKPNNILVNSSGHVKITDLGLSKIMDNSITRTYVGTTMYMAPERIRGGPYRMESDVWSFGLSLWELSIGRFPFKLPGDTLTVNSVIDFTADIQRIEGHPQEFCWLINGCLQHDVKQRWNMGDLKESVYIKEAWPIDHGVIGEFVGKFLNN
ncbi:kinase domain protein [Ancylostoma caninum]|uniref:mitogen-activated protein kinase kinase n=1 Tax=Ancylostoma caninum TaxID=29170 RepID=A0A368G0P5_ANCCA|nr:kinase domain protein [Ancylostoma caninum]